MERSLQELWSFKKVGRKELDSVVTPGRGEELEAHLDEVEPGGVEQPREAANLWMVTCVLGWGLM